MIHNMNEFEFGADFEQPPQQPTDNPFLTRAGQTLFTKGEFVSPNYKKGTSGWMVDEYGNVEFNDGVFRGDVTLGTTIRTVDTADEIQDAIDEVSSNGGGTIYLSPGTYNMTSHIDIPSNVYLIGASRSAVILNFGNAAFGVRSLGTVGTHITNILVKDLTIRNSSITGLKLQYNDVSLINGVDVTGCNIGIEMDNVDSVAISGMGVLCDGNATNIKITNSVSFSVYFSAAINSTSSHGLVLDTCSSATIFDSQFADNTGDGVNITSCSNIGFVSLAISGNGGQGVEFVSGNNDLQWSHTVIDSNTSDGIKLTATTDRVHFSSITSSNNGGYGINIAASTCDNNTLVGISYVANSSGTLNDSGTGTVVIGSTLSFKNGTTTKNAADASATQNIAHGLGVTPKYAKIKCIITDAVLAATTFQAEAIYNGTTQSSQSVFWDNASNTTIAESTFKLSIPGGTGAGCRSEGVVTFDATNIIITWTKTQNPVGTYYLLWEATG